MTDPTPVVEILTRDAQVIEEIVGNAVIVEIAGGFDTGSGTVTATVRGYRFEQSEPATVWTIEHRMGFDPAGITVVSTDGFGLDDFGVQYLVAGASLRLSFDIAVTGVAYLS